MLHTRPKDVLLGPFPTYFRRLLRLRRQWSGFDVRYRATAHSQSERQIQSSTRINILLVVL